MISAIYVNRLLICIKPSFYIFFAKSSMIEDVEKRGLIKHGLTTLVELTSGNIAIALAGMATQKRLQSCLGDAEIFIPGTPNALDNIWSRCLCHRSIVNVSEYYVNVQKY